MRRSREGAPPVRRRRELGDGGEEAGAEGVCARGGNAGAGGQLEEGFIRCGERRPDSRLMTALAMGADTEAGAGEEEGKLSHLIGDVLIGHHLLGGQGGSGRHGTLLFSFFLI